MPKKRNKRSSKTTSKDANNNRSGSASTSRKKQKTNDKTTELTNFNVRINYYDVNKGPPIYYCVICASLCFFWNEALYIYVHSN